MSHEHHAVADSRPTVNGAPGRAPFRVASTPFLAGLGRGFRTGVSLWPGLVPFALAYAVLARRAGLGPLDAQLMSVVVFAGGAQLTAVSLLAHGAGALEIVATTLLLNLRHVLYGLSLSERVPLRGLERLVAAHVLTDESFGVTMSARAPSFAHFLGAGASVFVPWNLATAVGLWAGQVVDPARVGADFVFPLAFVAMLAVTVETRHELMVAALAGGVALVLAPAVGTGPAVLAAVIAGTSVGTLPSTRAQPDEPRP